MLTLENSITLPSGRTVFRDFSSPTQYYYLPDERARVSDNGRGLNFVVYTEDIASVPDFSADEDRAGGFLTLEVELGPSPAELEAIKGEVAGVVDGDVNLSQVPFTSGSVTLFVLSQTGARAPGLPTGFEVTVAGSTRPSLFGRQTAVFSVRLGGKAANILWETLRTTADPQAVVTYDFEFLAIQPAYNLEVEIDFKETFSYLRHRVGLNLLVAAVDLDLLTQEMINEGSITVREVDFTGKGNPNSPVAGEGGILKLVKDLMSPTLFMTVPIPTPDYRALPDSATRALESASGTRAFLTSGTAGGGATQRTPTSAGTDLKITHTPVAPGQTPGGAVEISAVIEPASGVTFGAAKVLWRVQGGPAFQEVALERAGGASGPGSGSGPRPGSGGPSGPGSGPGVSGSGSGPRSGASGPGSGLSGPGLSGAGSGPRSTPASGGPATSGTNTYTGRIPGQPSGTTVEYLIRATGTKAGAAITQNLPEAGEGGPLSFSFGAAPAAQGTHTQFQVPMTDGPSIGYSLRSIEVSQQIKRTFKLNKAEAVTQKYHPSGALSANNIGPDFNPDTQITRVQLGEGPFRLLLIKIQAGFDFEKYYVKAVTVRIEYGKKPDGTLMHTPAVTLTKDKPSSQTQFFADLAGTQSFTYWVEFTYDPDRVVGTTPGQILESPKFTDVTTRSITVDLDAHSPLIPVEVQPGVLSLSDGLIKQVQVRVSPTAAAEGRIIKLDQQSQGDRVMVKPANPAVRTYHLQQKFFFQDGSTTIEKPGMVDTQVVVNEPADLVFKMIPQFADSTNLVKEVLVDAVYRHAAGAEERSTLHLTGTNARNQFGVLLAPGDVKEWDAAFRFVLHAGDPLEAPSQHLLVSEPLVTLKKAGFRVVTVSLLDELAFTNTDLLGIKVTLGANVNDPAAASKSMMLRSNRMSGSLVVPGVAADAAVSVAIEVLRRNQPAQRTTTTLTPSENELFVTT